MPNSTHRGSQSPKPSPKPHHLSPQPNPPSPQPSLLHESTQADSTTTIPFNPLFTLLTNHPNLHNPPPNNPLPLLRRRPLPPHLRRPLNPLLLSPFTSISSRAIAPNHIPNHINTKQRRRRRNKQRTHPPNRPRRLGHPRHERPIHVPRVGDHERRDRRRADVGRGAGRGMERAG